MIAPPKLADEARRVAAVHAFGGLDTPAEERFDRITRIACAAFGVPIAAVTLVDADRQWFKSCIGLDERESPRATSFCGHTILEDRVLVIPDARDDERFADNPLVTGPPHIRFYAGHPLEAPSGERIGTLCIIDRRPRELDAAGRALLQDLAEWAQEELGQNALDDLLLQMRRSESSLRAIMDGVAEGIITFDDQGRILSGNPAAERAFRVGPAGLTGQPIASLLHGVDWEVAARGLGARPGNGDPTIIGERHEFVGVRSDGDAFPLELVVTEVQVDGDRVFIGIGQDVTERKAVEARLRDSERRFRAIFDRAGIGIGLVDLEEGRLVDANPALADMLGWTQAELKALDRAAYSHPDDLAEDAPLLASLRAGRADRYRREKRFRRHDGKELWTAVTVTALPEPDARPRLAIAMIEDVTRRKEVERLRDEFVSVVGHELRTPLTSIRGSLGLVEAGLMGELPADAARMVAVAVSNSDRLIRLINDMLDMERMDSGRSELLLGPVTAGVLLEQAVQVVQAMADAAGVTLVAEAGDAVVWADSDRVVQALTNLIGNAVKFSPPGGAVEVTVASQRHQAAFSVRDAGRGIPADQLETIFERFRQVDASDAREKGGTGLGLAISRAIVEEHGGRIWAESRMDEETVFRFTIPLVQPGTDLSAESVLVVEDDPGLGETLAQAMRARETRVVRSAEEAIAAVGSAPPGVIVLDLGLPGRSGHAVIEHLREHGLTSTPVVVFSALDLGPGERSRLQLGRTVFLAKADSTPQEVARCAAQLLGRSLEAAGVEVERR